MPATDYPRTKVGGIKAGRLHRELNADVAITTVIDSVTEDSKGSAGFTVTAAGILGAGEITAMDAAITAHVVTVFNSKFQMWESSPVKLTALTTYQSAMSRTAQALVAGTYRVQWYWEMRLVTTGPQDSKAQARFQFGGVVKCNHSTIEEDWQAVSGWDRVENVADGDTPTFDIEYRATPAGNDSAEIRRMKMSFELVPA